MKWNEDHFLFRTGLNTLTMSEVTPDLSRLENSIDLSFSSTKQAEDGFRHSLGEIESPGWTQLGHWSENFRET